MLRAIASILLAGHCALALAQQPASTTGQNQAAPPNASSERPGKASSSAQTQDAKEVPGNASKRVAAMAESARTGTHTEREQAVDTLGESRSREAIPELSNILLQDSDANLRERSASSLGDIGDPSGVPALVKALSTDPVTSVSVSAAEALGRIGGPEAGAALLQGSNANRRVEVRTAAVRALGSVKTENSVQALRAYTQDPAPEVRYAAVDGLVKQQSQQAAQAIIGALDDQNADVAQRAAWALGELRDEAAVAPLLRKLESKGPVAVRRWSAIALGRIGNTLTTPMLSRSALDPREDISVRAASIEALGMLGKPAAGDTFRKALRDNHSILQTLAGFYSCQLRIAENVPAVGELLPSADAETRRSLITAMGLWPEPFGDRLMNIVTDKSEDSETRVLALSTLYELPPVAKRSLGDTLALELNPNEQVDVQLAFIGFLADTPSPSKLLALKKFSAVQGLDPRVRTALDDILKGNP